MAASNTASSPAAAATMSIPWRWKLKSTLPGSATCAQGGAVGWLPGSARCGKLRRAAPQAQCRGRQQALAAAHRPQAAAAAAGGQGAHLAAALGDCRLDVGVGAVHIVGQALDHKARAADPVRLVSDLRGVESGGGAAGARRRRRGQSGGPSVAACPARQPRAPPCHGRPSSPGMMSCHPPALTLVPPHTSHAPLRSRPWTQRRA